MKGKRWFKNCPAAWKAKPQVTKAIDKRVAAGKTVCLGEVGQDSKRKFPYKSYRVFPVGATGKKNSTEYRPVDDHTRTDLNEATDTELLKFSLASHRVLQRLFTNPITWRLKTCLTLSRWSCYTLLCGDSCSVFCWEYVDGICGGITTDDVWCLYCHIFAGFGMAVRITGSMDDSLYALPHGSSTV